MRRAAKVDGPHKAIVDAFRALGCSAKSTASLGSGFPDIIIAKSGKTALVEVKDGEAVPSKQKLNADQITFHAGWKGRIFVCKSIGEVPAIVESLPCW